MPRQSSYITFCPDNVTTRRTNQKNHINVFSNQKPWFNSEVKTIIKAQDTAFKSGDIEEYRNARGKLRNGIKDAKHNYKQRIEDHFNKNYSHSMWKRIKTINDYKSGNSQMPNNDTAFPDVLNHFFACFGDGSKHSF